MRIIVDGDACPSLNLITEIAKNYQIPLYIYVDTEHNIKNDYAHIITISTGYQATDMKIINSLYSKDILITSDYGLASLGLLKKAIVISPNGMEYTEKNIDFMLDNRYLNSKLRKQNIKISKEKARNKKDDENLKLVLINTIQKANQ